MCYIKPTEELEPMETSDDVVFVAEFTPMEEDSEYGHSTPAQDDDDDDDDVVFVEYTHSTSAWDGDDYVILVEYTRSTPAQDDDNNVMLVEYTPSTLAQDDGEYSQTTPQQQELQQQCCCCKNLKKIINKLNEIENQVKNLNS